MVFLQLQQPPRVAPQDQVQVLTRKLQLLHERVRILDVLCREKICPDDDPVRPNLVDQKAQCLRVVIKVVVMKAPDVFLERTLSLQLHRAHVVETMLHAGKNEWKCASAMGQDDLELRELVEGSGRDELRRGCGMFKREAQP